MSAIDDALAEISAAMVAMAPAHEGLRDYDRLDLTPAAADAIEVALAIYDARWNALEAAKEALEALQTTRYPDPPVLPPTSQAALTDLRANQATITVALGLFEHVEAVALLIVPDEPEDQ